MESSLLSLLETVKALINSFCPPLACIRWLSPTSYHFWQRCFPSKAYSQKWSTRNMKSFPSPSSHTFSISSVGLDFPCIGWATGQQRPQLCYICLLFRFGFFSSLYNYYLYHLLLLFVPFHLFPPKEALASLSLLYGRYGLYGPVAFRWVLGPLFFTFLFIAKGHL